MFMKNWFRASIVFFIMMGFVVTPGSLNAFAKSGVETQHVVKKVIEVKMYDDYFAPKLITIPHGKQTKLVLKNEGKEEHSFTVKELEIDAEVQPGQKKTITLRPKKPGTYKLICRYHEREGMVGKVVVK